MFNREKTETKRDREAREWSEKPLLEKAKDAIAEAEGFPYAPGQAAGFAAATAYLLLHFAQEGQQ